MSLPYNQNERQGKNKPIGYYNPVRGLILLGGLPFLHVNHLLLERIGHSIVYYMDLSESLEIPQDFMSRISKKRPLFFKIPN